MKYFCNPIDIEYLYQFNFIKENEISINRESADPSILFFRGKYYLFASMTLGVWVSDDLVTWEKHDLPGNLPMYDYAPDVGIVGEYAVFCASRAGTNGFFYRTKDILNGPYEAIDSHLVFWDPHLFEDEDNRLYFYWGCSNKTPIMGVELDRETLQPLTAPVELIYGDNCEKGYERRGDDHKDKESPPYIEGAWMNKHNGRYYLQYASPGTQHNIYSDGVYISERPLGPFRLAKNNPFSLKPGGFGTGAGHGSTFYDSIQKLWHASTISISCNHIFERRIGLWPAGFDKDGELFCNQQYGDWPICVESLRENPWKKPDWYLLSYNKPAVCSGFEDGKGPENACDEDIRTWWRAADARPGQWLQIDLEKEYIVHAVQVNFADDKIQIPVPGKMRSGRYIEEHPVLTRWKLEGSFDGTDWLLLENMSQAQGDRTHQLVVKEDGIRLRYVRLTVFEVPYGQKPCVSGLRIFGKGEGEKPAHPEFEVCRLSDIDMKIRILACENAIGFQICWGNEPEKLYHSYMIYGKMEQQIGALVRGEKYYVRVDAFNECGITEGIIQEVI